jgi:chaperonin GroES
MSAHLRDQRLVKPCDDRVVVRQPKARLEVTPEGLFIPEAATERPHEGLVLAVGPGRRVKLSEARTPCEVRPGDRVMFGKYDGFYLTVDGEELLMMRDTDVLCVIED